MLIKFQIDLQLFKTLIECVNEISKEICLEATPMGITLTAMDLSQCCLVDLEATSKLFTSYKVEIPTGKKRLEIGIATPCLLKILQKIPSAGKGNVACYISEKNESQLTICSDLNVDTGSQFTCDLQLLECEPLGLKIPPVDYDAQVKLLSDIFSSYVDPMASFGQEVAITISGKTNSMMWNTFQSSASNTKCNMYLRDMKELTVNAKPTENFMYAQKFPLSYMLHFLRAKKLFSHVELFFIDGQPLKLQYELEDKLKLVFYLAPKIE